jgi:hypothetical protein
LLLDDARIGHATIQNMILSQGTQEFEIIGTFDRAVLAESSEQYGKLLATLYIGGPAALDTTLSLQGFNVTSGDRELPWLLPVVRRFALPIPINPPPKNNFTQGFDMGFHIFSRTEGPRVTDGFIATNLTLPFQSRGLNLVINQIAHQVVIAADGRDFAILETQTSVATPVGNSSGIRSKFSSANLTLVDQATFDQKFLKPLIQQQMFDVEVSGNITVEIGTALGNATVNNLPQSPDTWSLNGYGNFTDGTISPTVRELGISSSTSTALLFLATFTFQGTGSIDVDVRY